MQYSKKTKKSQLSRKKVTDINPREYTIIFNHGLIRGVRFTLPEDGDFGAEVEAAILGVVNSLKLK